MYMHMYHPANCLASAVIRTQRGGNVYVYVYDSIDVISIGNNINPSKQCVCDDIIDVPSNDIHKVIYRHGGVLLLVSSVPAL